MSLLFIFNNDILICNHSTWTKCDSLDMSNLFKLAHYNLICLTWHKRFRWRKSAWGVFVATRTIASTLVPCCSRDREGCVTAKLSLSTCANSLTTHCSPARSWQWLLSTRLVNDSWLTNSSIPHHSPCLPSCLGSLVSPPDRFVKKQTFICFYTKEYK